MVHFVRRPHVTSNLFVEDIEVGIDGLLNELLEYF